MISQKEFPKINWFPIKERLNKCVISIAFKYIDNQCLHLLKEVFIKAPKCNSWAATTNLSKRAVKRDVCNRWI